MGKHRLVWYRWEDSDPFQKDKWTAWTVSIYEPTYDYPHVSVLVSVANGGGKCLFRYASVDKALERIIIPMSGLERLRLAETHALEVSEMLRHELRIISDMRNLPDGTKILRTDTGEIIAEAERIIKEANNDVKEG